LVVAVDVLQVLLSAKKNNLVINAEHSKHVEIDNQVITKL
jgi:hypothetical protein